MSAAHKCDKCGQFFESVKGCVTVDVAVATGDEDGTLESWPDIELCPSCSKPFLEMLKEAMGD